VGSHGFSVPVGVLKYAEGLESGTGCGEDAARKVAIRPRCLRQLARLERQDDDRPVEYEVRRVYPEAVDPAEGRDGGVGRRCSATACVTTAVPVMLVSVASSMTAEQSPSNTRSGVADGLALAAGVGITNVAEALEVGDVSAGAPAPPQPARSSVAVATTPAARTRLSSIVR
jgi:hypothetical protein